MMESGDEYRTTRKTPPLHHIIRTRKRQERRTVKQIRDDQGTTHTTSMTIIKAFTMYFRTKFQPIRIDEHNAKQMMECVTQTEPSVMCTALEAPITMEELRHAISKGKSHKAPGPDGIGLEFYKTAWETIKVELLQIMNLIYLEGIILRKQLQGLIVCIPKHAQPKTIDDYRPLTLMNIDYKILTRIIAERLRPFMPTILHPHQFCGLQGNSVFEAVAVVREAIAYAETAKKPICIVSIDFSTAFDRISHEYLYKVLSSHGFDDLFIQRIKTFYGNATSEKHINDFRSDQIQIQRSMRQECPLSMLIYAYV